jgi:uncharacterized protein YeaO (DUF488 family)
MAIECRSILMAGLKIKRVYDEPERADGRRILVDRLWPRGLSKEKAKVDLWLKEIAPSTELRKQFCHDPEKWPAFRTAYLDELKQSSELLEPIHEAIESGDTTLLYAAKDELYNNAVVLKEYLESHP